MAIQHRLRAPEEPNTPSTRRSFTVFQGNGNLERVGTEMLAVEDSFNPDNAPLHLWGILAETALANKKSPSFLTMRRPIFPRGQLGNGRGPMSPARKHDRSMFAAFVFQRRA